MYSEQLGSNRHFKRILFGAYRWYRWTPHIAARLELSETTMKNRELVTIHEQATPYLQFERSNVETC